MNIEIKDLPTPEEFDKMCKNHDWWYCMTDDLRVWKAGDEQERKLKKIANSGEVYSNIFYEHRDKNFKR